MTLEEAIKHCEEVAKEQDKLFKQYDDASKYSRSYNKDIVSANAKKCLECFECAKEHRQLAEWLKELKQYREQGGDAINRQATVERLCRVADFMNEKREGLGSPYVMAALFIQDNKDEFPPVTPQPKMGKWITSSHGFPPEPTTVCSECGFDRDFYVRSRGFDKIKYCPNCGAKMEVEG